MGARQALDVDHLRRARRRGRGAPQGGLQAQLFLFASGAKRDFDLERFAVTVDDLGEQDRHSQPTALAAQAPRLPAPRSARPAGVAAALFASKVNALANPAFRFDQHPSPPQIKPDCNRTYVLVQ